MNKIQQHAQAWLPKMQSYISSTPRRLFPCCFIPFASTVLVQAAEIQHSSKDSTRLLPAENPIELPWASPAPWSCGTKSQRVQNNSLKQQWVGSAAHFWGLSQYVSYLGFSWKLDCFADKIKADSKGKRHQGSEATWTMQRKYLHGQQMKVTWSSN